MKAFPCCRGHLLPEQPACSHPDPDSPLRRTLRALGLVISSLVLVLMPKCPACVAAYAALLTGLSLSASAAGQVRVILIVICTGVLVFLMVGRIGRWARRKG